MKGIDSPQPGDLHWGGSPLRPRQGKGHRWAVCLALLLALGLGLCLLQRSPAPARADNMATVSCRVEPNPGVVGQQATLFIEVQNVDNLYGYQLKLHYNPAQVEVLDEDPGQAGVNLVLDNISTFVVQNQASNGLIELAASLEAPELPLDGDVPLAHGRVRGLGIGATSFTFEVDGVILADGSSAPIPSQTVNCEWNIIQGYHMYLPLVLK